jgi:hypothetical protein
MSKTSVLHEAHSALPVTLPGRRWQLRKAPARAIVLGALVAFALAVVGQAFGAVTPHLLVSTSNAGTGNSLTIAASKQQADDPLAQVQFYIPTGFGLDSPAIGATVGSATAKVTARDISPNSETSLTGTVTAIATTDPSVSFENSSCDTNTHVAAWMVHLTGTVDPFSFPIFVDATTGPAAAFGPYELVACFRSPDLPQGSTGRSTQGDVLDSMILTLNPFTFPTVAGSYRWRSLWTPFTVGAATMNTAGDVEAQSIVTAPTGVLTILGKKTTISDHGKTFVHLAISGKLLVNGNPLAGAIVAIRHGSTKAQSLALGSVTTSPLGTFLKKVLLTQTAYFELGTTIGEQDLGAAGCTASFGTAVACVDATDGASRVVSGSMYVTK